MAFTNSPKQNHGFIYILSNASMPGVYKVGLTTNSVHQRAQELSSTGVPTEFRAEKIFEIEVHHLRSVEQNTHNKLKRQNYHQGKEFFRAPLDYVVEVVEDTIFEITRQKAPDLIGQAALRAAERERVAAVERERAARERERVARERQEQQRKQAREAYALRAWHEARQEAESSIREYTLRQFNLKDPEGSSVATLAFVLIWLCIFIKMPLDALVHSPPLVGLALFFIWLLVPIAYCWYVYGYRKNKFYSRLAENKNSYLSNAQNAIYRQKLEEFDRRGW